MAEDAAGGTHAVPLQAQRGSPGVLESVQSLVYALVVTLFVMTFTVQPIRIPSESMEPTLLVGDFLLMDKQAVEGDAHGVEPPVSIRRGDVVVFHDPVDDPGVHLVKRVIGVPGDRIHLRGGAVYRNGQRLTEPFAVYRLSGIDRFRDDFPNLQTMDTRVNPNWWIRLRGMVREGEITVPAGSYFVMGDNRNNSEDSRFWGFVPRQAIVGKPLLVYFSERQQGDEDDYELEAMHPARKTGRIVEWLGFARWGRTFHVVR